jgi:sugar/nucleoside kinase (ribokinase family)
VEKWLYSVDIVQMNENEILTISTRKNEFDRIREILSAGPEMAIITKAERGAVLYRKENDEIERIFVSSVKEPGENRVGCGDVFGAAFFYSYICGNSIYTALKFANTAAGVITNYFNFKNYENLKNDIGKRFY